MKLYTLENPGHRNLEADNNKQTNVTIEILWMGNGIRIGL